MSTLVSTASERTELALHLSDITAIPFADPALIIGRLGARRKIWRRELKEPLPLGVRAHGCAAPAIAFRVSRLAWGGSRFTRHFGPTFRIHASEHELRRDVFAQCPHHACHLPSADLRVAQLYRRGRSRRNVKGRGDWREGCAWNVAIIVRRVRYRIEEDEGAWVNTRVQGSDR